MTDNRKAKIVFREEICDTIIQVNCRYNPDTNNIGFINDVFSKSHHNAEERKFNSAHRDEQNNYSMKYRENHHDERVVYDRRKAFTTPMVSFLGKKHLMKYHDHPPEGYVYHHTVYDHANPEANIVLLSRSSHTMGHKLLKKLGIEIPHINKGVE